MYCCFRAQIICLNHLPVCVEFRTLATSKEAAGSNPCSGLDVHHVSDSPLNRGPGLINPQFAIVQTLCGTAFYEFIFQHFISFRFNSLPAHGVMVQLFTSLWFNQILKCQENVSPFHVENFFNTYFFGEKCNHVLKSVRHF